MPTEKTPQGEEPLYDFGRRIYLHVSHLFIICVILRRDSRPSRSAFVETSRWPSIGMSLRFASAFRPLALKAYLRINCNYTSDLGDK